MSRKILDKLFVKLQQFLKMEHLKLPSYLNTMEKYNEMIPQYKNVYRRTIEIAQRYRIFKVNCFLKVHNAHQKLLLLISGWVESILKAGDGLAKPNS